MQAPYSGSRLLAIFALLLLCTPLRAQTIVRFAPVLDGQPLALGAAAGTKTVEVLRWYLSQLTLLHDGRVVYTEPDSHSHIRAGISR